MNIYSKSFIYKDHHILFSIYRVLKKEANLVIAFLLEVTSSLSLADICRAVNGGRETLYRTSDSAGVLKEILCAKVTDVCVQVSADYSDYKTVTSWSSRQSEKVTFSID